MLSAVILSTVNVVCDVILLPLKETGPSEAFFFAVPLMNHLDEDPVDDLIFSTAQPSTSTAELNRYPACCRPLQHFRNVLIQNREKLCFFMFILSLLPGT